MRKRVLNIRSVVLPLIFINIAVFIIQLVNFNAVTPLLWIDRYGAFFEPWTLITSMFAHGSIGHILINMWVLFMFGPLVERRIGPKRFLILYFAAGIFASLASNFLYNSALGASGALMGVIGVAIILMPELRVFIFPIPIPISLRTAGIIFAIVDILGLIPGVAHAAHLAGLTTGLVYGLKLSKEKRRFHRKFSGKTVMNTDDMEDYLRNGRI